MADVAYAAMLEQLEGDARAAIASGRAEVDMDEVRERFDRALTEEPEPGQILTLEQVDLRQALGVA